MEHATIYTTFPGQLSAKALERVEGVTSVTSDGGWFRKATQYQLQTVAGGLTLNMMPDAERPGHLDGFAGFVFSLHQRDPIPDVEEALQFLGAVQEVIGCVPEQPFEPADDMARILATITMVVNGLVLLKTGLFNPQGQAILPFPQPEAPSPEPQPP